MGSGSAFAQPGGIRVGQLVLAVVLLTANARLLYPAESASELARAAAASGDYVSAERHYRDALKTDGQDPRLWNGLGIALNRLNRFADAAEAFQRAASLSPGVAGLQLNVGIALYRAGKLAEAAQALEKVQELEQARELLGTTYVALERYDRALPILEPMAKSSTDPAMHIALATCYERLGRKADVEKAMAHMFEVVPDSAALHVALAEAYERVPNLDRAIAEYRRALEMDPSLPGAHFQLGRILWRAHRFEEAEPEFLAALRAEPATVEANLYLGTAFLYRDQPARALPYLEEFVRQRTNEQKGYFELGRALLMDGKPERAIAPLEKAVSMQPDDAGMHFILGQAYRDAGRLKDAQREFQKTKELGGQASAASNPGTSSSKVVGETKDN